MVEEKKLGRVFTWDSTEHYCNTADAIGFMNSGGSAYIRLYSVSPHGFFEDIYRLPSFSGTLLNKT